MFGSFSFTNMCLVPGHTFCYFYVGCHETPSSLNIEIEKLKLPSTLFHMCVCRGYVMVV